MLVLSLPPAGCSYAKDMPGFFSEEEKMFRETVREFCQKYIAPRWVEIDEKASIDPLDVPIDLIKKMGEQGLFCIANSDKYGGQGGSYTMAAIAVEEIAYADPAVALAVYALLNNGWPFMLEYLGKEEVCQEVIPRVAKGEAFFGIATTEPQGGSDIAGIRMTATKKGRAYVFNGEKAYISGVGEAFIKLPWGGGFFLVARTAGSPGDHKGLSAFAFIGRRNGKLRSGISPTVYHDIGRCGLTTGGFICNDVELEDVYLLGEEGRGFYYVMEGFNAARIVVSAACIGGSRWLLDQAVQWFHQRRLFGRPIASFQGVNFKFAELYARYEAARYFVYRAARLLDKIYLEKDPSYKPQDLNVPVALAKMEAPETAVDIAEEVMKWYGAYAYTKESPIFRAWLGLFSYVIGAEGAQNIMRYIIARDTIGAEAVRKWWA
ncbi:MAG: acyl-CoA/acyl-ACP dehydrogenase [Candidatus Nezhaarchaeota archaeon]|nr:acyl-CoA/acyl-ACP dehydrogenase [Candidatus Nezhaarchaeota archaeon]